jgi:hypothetical protein
VYFKEKQNLGKNPIEKARYLGQSDRAYAPGSTKRKIMCVGLHT